MPRQVVIIGGAAIGSSVAAQLAMRADADAAITVVERDPTYRFAASALSAASIRQQFSTAVNVAVSQFGIAFLREAGSLLAVGGDRPDIGLHEGGYLYLEPPPGGVLAANHRLQRAMGADVALLDPDALRRRFPWLRADDLHAGSLGLSGEGWFDGYGLLQAFRRKARSLGVRYLAAEARRIVMEAGRVGAVELADGSRLAADVVVNAAGAGGRAMAASAGVDIPVAMKKRSVFAFTAEAPPAGSPLVIDPSGVWFRPEGRGFICAIAPPGEDPDSADFTVDHHLFEDHIWPALAHRVPAFERIRPGRAWAGHYDMCLFDHNAIVGSVPGVEGLLLANGFSGHGLQQAPAVGRGLAELIAAGRYETLDLAPLGFERLGRNAPLLERNVI